MVLSQLCHGQLVMGGRWQIAAASDWAGFSMGRGGAAAEMDGTIYAHMPRCCTSAHEEPTILHRQPSTTSTKTHLSGQHSADSLRARRRWSQRFPQRRPHKQSKLLETTVLPTPNRSGAPQEQQRALAVSKQFPTRGFQSLERPGKENTPNALLRGLGGLHQADGGARRAAPSPPPGPTRRARTRSATARTVPPRCPPGAPPGAPPAPAR